MPEADATGPDDPDRDRGPDGAADEPHTGEEPAAGSGSGGSGRPPRVGAGFVTIVVLAFVVPLAVGAFLLTRGSESVEYRYVVPPGTGARIDKGEPVEIIPRELEVGVGDVLIVENDDDETHLVGPFPVRAGETYRYQFQTPGEIQGACSLHPSGKVTIIVT